MDYWTALKIVTQVAGELGLPAPATLVATDDPQINQLTALLNASGNELITFYTWEQFTAQWTWPTVANQDAYPLPLDWLYFVDQTQWDRTNHWPLLGPKSPQEWSWLKGGLLQAAPRMRYRVYQDKFQLHPVPGSTSFTMSMEYIVKNWILKADSTTSDFITADSDKVMFHPWLMVKFVKLKFYELKGFDISGVTKDFDRLYNAMTGKNKGGQKLSLSPRYPPLFIGPWSIPDGSWDVSVGLTP